ncbi:hypothetical protein [Streptomyces sp. NPDC051994]|uniref:hypothetical protein n=1 Tax=unclassified Streptomyces TaxID=2593676 RepID=UPI003422B9ED
MDRRIATISGTMLTPGVSRNQRLYSAELIAKAAKRMSERIADPDGLPIVMRTHHEAGDDSVRIVGRLTDVRVGEDGAARYRADLYDTAHGRDIAALVTGKTPALKSVSIHGYWLGPVKRVQHDGESVTTGDDLEIDALDFTATPGVPGASVAAASYLDDRAPAESMARRTPISESAEATVEAITEEASAEAYSAQQKRDALATGQAMKNASDEPSYPIKSKADLRKAIRAVGRGGADHDKIRAHIVARAKALGLTSMIPDNWKADGSMKENTTRYSDVREYYPDGPGGEAGFCIDAYNGPTSITIRNCAIDPKELRVIAAAAMDAVANALQQLDPDMDADIDVDVDGAPNADTDRGGDESAPTAATEAAEAPSSSGALTSGDIAVLHAARDSGVIAPGTFITPQVLAAAHALTETAPPDRGAATTHTEEEAAMGEPTTETTQTEAPARSLTDGDIAALGALFGAALKENLAPLLDAVSEKAPKPKATSEATETVGEPKPKSGKKALKETVADLQATFDAKLTEALAKQRDDLRDELLRENGLPSRKGYRLQESNTDEEQLTGDALWDKRGQVWDQFIPGGAPAVSA